MKKMLLSILFLSIILFSFDLLMLQPNAASDPDEYIFDISEGSIIIGQGSAGRDYLRVLYTGDEMKDNIPNDEKITIIQSYPSASSHTLQVRGGIKVSIELQDVNIAAPQGICALSITGDSTVSLTLLGTNKMSSAHGAPGISLPKNNTLIIEAKDTKQILDVQGGGYYPAIGVLRASADTMGKVIINGGNITAKGSMGGAGIGCSIYGDGGYEIIINGGIVNAIGSAGRPEYAAGIGSCVNMAGRYGSSIPGTITINGGTVTAEGANGHVGIGSSRDANNDTVIINSGSVYFNNQSSIDIKNSSNEPVYLNTLTVGDPAVTDHISIEEIWVDNTKINDIEDNVITRDDGKLYLWLPKNDSDNASVMVKASDAEYGSTYPRAAGEINSVLSGPNLAISNNNITFNMIYGASTPKEQIVELINRGTYTAAVNSITLNKNQEYDLIGIPSLPTSIIVGGKSSFMIRPRDNLLPGIYTDTITVTYNGGAKATAAVRMLVKHEAPTASINYEDEILNGLTANTEYLINAVSLTANSNGEIPIQDLWYGRNLSIIRKGSTPEENSEIQTLSVPQRPDAPNTVTSANETVQGIGDGKLLGLTAAMEYREDRESDWSPCQGTVVEGLASGTYYVRFSAVTDSGNEAFRSKTVMVEIGSGAAPTNTLNITVPNFDVLTVGYTQPDAEAIVIYNSGNSEAKMSEVAVSGSIFELVISGAESRYVPSGEINKDWHIQPVGGVKAGVYRETITITCDNGYQVYEFITLTVKTELPEASVNYVTEKLQGLDAETTYRIAGNEITADNKGEISIADAWFGNTIDIVKAGMITATGSDARSAVTDSDEIIVIDDRESVCEGRNPATGSDARYLATDSDAWDRATDSDARYLAPFRDIRSNETDSDALYLYIPMRPAAPDAIVVMDETAAGRYGGRIIGVTAAMEYSRDGGRSWTACPDREITGLAKGIYSIRYMAVTEPGSEAFASEITEVTIKYGQYQSAEDTSSEGGTIYGWQRDSTGWWYQEANGSYPRAKWMRINGIWYYFDQSGYMATGWRLLNNKWYWLDPGSGNMVASDWVFYQSDWYYLGADGAMVTGWQSYKGHYYYLSMINDRYYGHMLRSEMTPDGHYVDSEGIWISSPEN